MFGRTRSVRDSLVVHLEALFSQLGRKVELGLAKSFTRELIDQNQELIENRGSYATLM